jgi:hypothetical protein
MDTRSPHRHADEREGREGRGTSERRHQGEEHQPKRHVAWWRDAELERRVNAAVHADGDDRG